MCRCKEENGWLDCCLVVQGSLLKKVTMNFAFIFNNQGPKKLTEMEKHIIRVPEVSISRRCRSVDVLLHIKLYEDLFFQHLLMAGNITLILLFLIWQQIQAEFV